MKPKMLETNGEDQLTITGIHAHDVDVSFDFEKSSLIYQKLTQPKYLSSYIISPDLVNAVNAAIVTGRPLLLKGEPGCGKTKLAQAVAAHFYGKDTYKYFFEWHVKSKSKAKDGGYSFDHVGRLRDATVSSKNKLAESKAAEASNYVTMGAMGKAFKTKLKSGNKPILLIDEIDKGDIDFPNDLLLELDEMRFQISEMPGVYIEASKDSRPLVFITSNNERELPPAFLRRCLYYYIPPFEKEVLNTIARSKIQEFYQELHINDPKDISEEGLATFTDRFIQLKETANSKPPSTSEMLDWLKLLTFHLNYHDHNFEDLIEDEALQAVALKLNA